jgi:hypothetical protein
MIANTTKHHIFCIGIIEMNVPSNGTFVDDLFPTWAEKFVPREHRDRGRQIIGYLDNSEFYGNSCSAIGVEIKYEDREVGLFFIPNKGKPIREMSGNELISGDGFLSLTYGADDWAEFVENMGTFEALCDRIQRDIVWNRRRHLVKTAATRRRRRHRKTRRTRR